MTVAAHDTLLLEEIPIRTHEKVVKVTDKASGLVAIIAIHDTQLGPSLGGTRIYPYATFQDALNDVLRLSRGMTHKSAIAETAWGGGKSVIISSPNKKVSEEQLLAFGAALNTLKGAYIAAEDVGCTLEDLRIISTVSPYLVGIPNEKSSGDPCPYTAWGTFRGIQAVLKKIYQSESLVGHTIALQGVGSVGEKLTQLLFWHGAKLILSDVNKEKVERLAKFCHAQIVPTEKIHAVECTLFAPCALGGILNPDTIPELKCRGVAGCANNQLLSDEDGEELMRRNILYAPDFVINAGGLINVTQETLEEGYNPFVARNRVDKIYDQLMLIFDIARKNNCSTQKAAASLVDYRLKYGIGKRTEPVYLHHANMSY
ncbi:MAG TPA: Glu/Leu/Phe/Val dehydrogenase dimerization domain-containing protein [Rhabdochlamydiaceae bacterium]|nr:Glu/Leu/Phe/Val dehydrogenase dimerization domain-containing protein [Rhabdochlamydiaceae bacterium]